MAAIPEQNLPPLDNHLVNLLDPLRRERGALVERQRQSWKAQAESSLVAAAWIAALSAAEPLPSHWRQAEGESWQALRRAATPGDFQALASLFKLASPDLAAIPHPAFWLGLGIAADKPENYAAVPLVKPWLAFLRLPPMDPTVQAWLENRNPDCLAFLMHSAHPDTQRQAFDLLGACARRADALPDCCDAVLASIRRLGGLRPDALLTHQLWLWLKDRVPLGSPLALAWLEDPHPQAAEMALWLAVGSDAPMSPKLLATMAPLKPGIGAWSILHRAGAGVAEWCDYVGQCRHPLAWISWLRDHQTKQPEHLAWLDKTGFRALIAASAPRADLGQSDRAALVALFAESAPTSEDPLVLELCLPLFPAHEPDSATRERLDTATRLLQGYYPQANPDQKKDILAALNSWIAIQCAACRQYFRWPDSHNGPSLGCPHCNEPMIQVAYGGFGWIGAHKDLNRNKRLPRLSPREP